MLFKIFRKPDISKLDLIITNNLLYTSCNNDVSNVTDSDLITIVKEEIKYCPVSIDYTKTIVVLERDNGFTVLQCSDDTVIKMKKMLK